MSRQMFSGLKERLLEAGIAPRHVRRYVRELEDHFEDLTREEAAKGLQREAAQKAARARLGGDEALAASMLARPGLRSLSARFPWAVFGLGPLALLFAMFVGAVILEGTLLKLHLSFVQVPGAPRPVPPEWLVWAAAAWNGLMTYAAPLGVAVLMAAVGLRQRMGAGWIALGVVVACILGAPFEMGIRLAGAAGRDELYLGYALAPPFAPEMIGAGLWRAGFNAVLAGAAYWLWLRRSHSAVAD